MQAAIPAQAGAPSAAVLSCRGLRKVYRMGEVDVRALDGVDFELRTGELLVLLGPSGSGKSTLLNILGGLDVPTEGQVFFRDQELTLAGDERRQHPERCRGAAGARCPVRPDRDDDRPRAAAPAVPYGVVVARGGGRGFPVDPEPFRLGALLAYFEGSVAAYPGDRVKDGARVERRK